MTPPDPARALPRHDAHYIAGRWTTPLGRGHIDVVEPATEEAMATIPRGDAADADAAVAAAKAAFPAWSALAVAERAACLQRVADGLGARADELARLMAREIGMPISQTPRMQVAGPVAQWAHYAAIGPSMVREERVGHSLVVREPVGVIAAITPWNYPLNQITLKVAPALLAGCTVVLKPSEVAPLNACVLAEVIDAAGLPPGVFNLVLGDGPEVGEALARHPDVDGISFTGSTRAGKRVSELAAATVKRVSLELGGKSANVVLDGADLKAAVTGGVTSCFMNAGQTCVAQTRLVVPRQRLDEVRELARALAADYRVGPSLDAQSRLGPLVSDAQRQRVLGYIDRGLAEGAELVVGGPGAPAGLERGYYVRPTVFIARSPDATIAQEEIFGPVLTIIPHDGEDDAVRIANDSPYGLGGAVWAADDATALRVARRIRTGQLNVNGGAFNPQAPFGGFKQSGIGREAGHYGLDEFLEYKALHLRTAT